MESTAFTVDAALLRELGERLIGRSYIALAELVKNSYDADATNCTIQFGTEEITVADNGHGISEREFHDHWMRIGTTHKTDRKTSRRLGRPMTGAKGLGRLSVQFLADEMTLETTSADEPWRYLYAFVDWTGIRRGEDLDTVDVLWEMRSGKREYPGGRATGTRIVLKALRSTWDTDEIGKLGQHVWMLQPPYRRPDRWTDDTAQDFYIDIDAPDIERAKEAFSRFEDALFRNWKARIRGSLVDGRSRQAEESEATVSVEFKAGYPKNVGTSNTFGESITLPVDPRKSRESAIDRAKFEILIFKPARPATRRNIRSGHAGVSPRLRQCVRLRRRVPTSLLRRLPRLAEHRRRPRSPIDCVRTPSVQPVHPRPLYVGSSRAGSDIRFRRDRYEP